MSLLAAAAAQGRWLLIGGLALGILLPGLATRLAPTIVPVLAVMLCIAALREGPRAALPRRTEAPRVLAITLILQCLLPLAAGGLLFWAGLLSAPLATGVVLALAAAPITGAPGLAVMSGADAGAALRQLTVGTALLPLTAAPVFALLPVFPDPWAIAAGALRLLALVGLAAGLAVALRALIPALTRPAARPAMDGLMALAMALVVIGLMSAIGPAAREAPGRLLLVLALATALHLGQTMGSWYAARPAMPGAEARAVAIVAGNRNLALFLAAVPPETAGALMVFVGCYQIPMYLTPMVLPRLTGAPRAGG
ncbi:hypothetical protein [Antarcticimicrobium luteum]|uniref:Bile acid:sodium symporter n=1 Tax=Antarcticimicrobium luteum TaxID=2547397 RepID=A0A4R5VCH5_9RHOB|nr:hypothetical protein [Antarcticimicrobium luteum]TDK49811.1 hypothetical protein E1832_07985 [Antarcticimicrobium luteum]